MTRQLGLEAQKGFLHADEGTRFSAEFFCSTVPFGGKVPLFFPYKWKAFVFLQDQLAVPPHLLGLRTANICIVIGAFLFSLSQDLHRHPPPLLRLERTSEMEKQKTKIRCDIDVTT